MSAPVLLPGLRGDDALGFLAAVGLVALSEQAEIPPLRLGWEGRGAPVAFVDGPTSVEQLGDELTAALGRIAAGGQVLPGVPPDFPLPSPGVGSDVMRMGRETMRALYGRFDRAWREEDSRWPARWLVAIAGQSTVRASGKNAFVELTPFYAPTGQMKLRSALFEFPMRETAGVHGPADALVRWRRKRGYSGGNFDSRALHDGAYTTTGDADNAGAPSPTWLAAMGVRYFTMADRGTSVSVLGWRRAALYPGYTNRSLIWPTWQPALSPSAMRALLGHPALQLEQRGRYELVPMRPAELLALGVSSIFGASRRTLSQGDGPLGPARRIWPAP